MLLEITICWFNTHKNYFQTVLNTRKGKKLTKILRSVAFQPNFFNLVIFLRILVIFEEKPMEAVGSLVRSCYTMPQVFITEFQVVD